MLLFDVVELIKHSIKFYTALLLDKALHNMMLPNYLIDIVFPVILLQGHSRLSLKEANIV